MHSAADIPDCCSKLKGMQKEYGRKGKKRKLCRDKGKKEGCKGKR
jgi:hypothetical protein